MGGGKKVGLGSTCDYRLCSSIKLARIGRRGKEVKRVLKSDFKGKTRAKELLLTQKKPRGLGCTVVLQGKKKAAMLGAKK